jgi:hypothetical protein
LGLQGTKNINTANPVKSAIAALACREALVGGIGAATLCCSSPCGLATLGSGTSDAAEVAANGGSLDCRCADDNASSGFKFESFVALKELFCCQWLYAFTYGWVLCKHTPALISTSVAKPAAQNVCPKTLPRTRHTRQEVSPAISSSY